jgi:predicted nucleic acid-binding protein
MDCITETRASPAFHILASTRDGEWEALDGMRNDADQRVSFTGCVSHAIMRLLRIRTALTFHRHFRLAVLGRK